MNLQKHRPVIANRRASRPDDMGQVGDLRVLQSSLVKIDELSIADDDDPGCDPYNSTGQHCILKLKQSSGD